MTTALQQSLAWAMAQLADPEYLRITELGPAWIAAETTGQIGGQATPYAKNGAVWHRGRF